MASLNFDIEDNQQLFIPSEPPSRGGGFNAMRKHEKRSKKSERSDDTEEYEPQTPTSWKTLFIFMGVYAVILAIIIVIVLAATGTF